MLGVEPRHSLATSRRRRYPAVVLCVVTALAGCGGGSTATNPATVSGGAGTEGAYVAAVRALCVQVQERVRALPPPSGASPTSAAGIKYATEVMSIADGAFAQMRAIRGPQPLFGRLSTALQIEAQGQKLVDAEVPALRSGDVGKAQALAAQARALTAPADAVFRSAGLGLCVGS